MTNILQTTANKTETNTNIWPTNRKRQMVWLSLLTACTLVGQYMMLGETGLSKKILGGGFEWVELGLWGARALVEVFIVVYIAMTKTNNEQEAAALNRFKIGLIALIVMTVGPVWLSRQYAAANLDSILSVYGTYVWGFSLAGISATMLWGVATAYKYQPVDDGYYVLPIVDYNKMLATVGDAESAMIEAKASAGAALVARDEALAELRGMREAVAILRFLPPSAQVQIIALFANGRPAPELLSDALGIKASTVRGVYAKLED